MKNLLSPMKSRAWKRPFENRHYTPPIVYVNFLRT